MQNKIGNSKILKLPILNTSELERIHQASIKILSETGVNIHSKEIRSLLKDADAKVKDNLRIFILNELLKKSLSTVPSKIKICNRERKMVMFLESINSYLGIIVGAFICKDKLKELGIEWLIKDLLS